jgi:hypothetical protein
MYGELASVKGTVDLSPQEALDQAEGFLASQGYIIEQRTFTTVTAHRRPEGEASEQDLLNLTVAVVPQQDGGVRMTVRGTDQAGVRDRQAAWLQWSESLPKKAESETAEAEEQDVVGTADVQLPPPPQVESADVPPRPQAPPTRGFAPTATTAPRPHRSLGFWTLIGAGGCLTLVVLLVGLAGLLAALGSGGSGSGGSGSGTGGSSGSGGLGSEETFTRENYGVLVANPDEHRGATVDVTGQLLDNPESQGDLVAFQMWADPVKVNWSTIVRTDETALGLSTDDYVHVRGTVLGSIEGENAFGGTVSAVEVDADEVERVDAMAAVDPTQKTVEVGQTRGAEGFSVTLKKLEFGPKHTRVYLTARNDSDKAAKFDFYASKIVQGGDRVGQNDPWDYNLPKPQAGLQPGEETEGAVIFGRADPSQPLQVSFAWQHGGFMADRPEPIVFGVAP